MKLFLAMTIFLAIPAFAQNTGLAKATYARNGVLIGLTDLAPLSNCKIQGMKGKVRSVRFEGGMVIFELKQNKEIESYQFSLERLGEPEKKSLRRGFMKKGIPLRASGYACKEGEPVTAISIDRSYSGGIRIPGIH